MHSAHSLFIAQIETYQIVSDSNKKERNKFAEEICLISMLFR